MITIYYILQDCGDGSAAASFFLDKELAELALKVNGLQMEKWGGFAENYLHTLEIETDSPVLATLPNNTQTKEDWELELKEIIED